MKLVSIPANPVPDHVVSGAIKTPDGVNLRFARWDPPPGRRGTVVVLQGRAEYIEKYFETVRDLRARGFAVATFDWRGQGLSDRALPDRQKGYVRNFSQYATDLEAFMAQIARRRFSRSAIPWAALLPSAPVTTAAAGSNVSCCRRR
jgi:lysophospholipase